MSPPIAIVGRDEGQTPIRTIEDWERLASTKGKWASGFSAKELAELWLTGEGPAAVEDALAPALPGLSITRAVPEAQIPFDQFRGGVRNHDVLAYGAADCGNVVVGIEGKVNESLDDTLKGKYDAARRLHDKGETTYLDKRVDGLLDAIVGKRLEAAPGLGGLRYQLFSAIAGTAAAARQDTAAAAVVVHLIRTPSADPKKFTATRQAVEDFRAALDLKAADGIVGPLRLRQPIGNEPPDMPIWLAVIETDTAADH